MSSNPYSDNELQSPNPFQTQITNPAEDGYVKQVPVLGILNIVQASLELMMFLLLLAMSAFMIVSQNSPQIKLSKNLASMQMMGVAYGVIGAVVGITAILRLTSGILMLKKQGRVFSIIVSMIGLVSVFTCYCAPTSLALAIYSLVVLIQPSVIEVFHRRQTESGTN